MVRQELVPPENILEGDVATIRSPHGDTVLYPLARVPMEVDGIPTEVEAAVSTTLPVSFILRDVPELQQLIGSKAMSDYSGSEDVMIVITRAQAK